MLSLCLNESSALVGLAPATPVTTSIPKTGYFPVSLGALQLSWRSCKATQQNIGSLCMLLASDLKLLSSSSLSHLYPGWCRKGQGAGKLLALATPSLIWKASHLQTCSLLSVCSSLPFHISCWDSVSQSSCSSVFTLLSSNSCSSALLSCSCTCRVQYCHFGSVPCEAIAVAMRMSPSFLFLYLQL